MLETLEPNAQRERSLPGQVGFRMSGCVTAEPGPITGEAT